MIRLNVSLTLTDAANGTKLTETATKLTELSLHDKGCVDYDFYRSQTNDDRFMIIETWRNRHDLEAHQKTAHFKELLPRLEELSTVSLEIFEF